LLNHFSAGRILPYPEQKAEYVVPERYLLTASEKDRSDATPSLGVTPTDTLSSGSEVIAHQLELDQSGRPREEEVAVPKDVILVTWEGDDDPENPLNWLVTPTTTRQSSDGRSFGKKCWTLFAIMIMTTTVYMASAIWSPAVTIGAEHFGVSELISTLGITTFGMPSRTP